MVQFREKNKSINNEVKDRVLFLQKILNPFKTPLIINDFVELAREINADGVHIGQQDMNVRKAREILGPNKIIGLSIESFDELSHANNQKDLTYISASAIFTSRTKPNCKKQWGLGGLKKLVLNSIHPTMAIGGINIYNSRDVFNTGVDGIAVIGAIKNSSNPCKTAKMLINNNRSNNLEFKSNKNI